jgi:glycosyltransferase involved in cell wall biosynthesis
VDEVVSGPGRNIFFLINSLTKGGAERQVVTLQKALGGKIILLENTVQYDEVDAADIITLSSEPAKGIIGKLRQYIQSIFKLRALLTEQQDPIVISFLERSNALNLVSSFLSAHKCILSVRINLDIQYRSAPLFRIFAKLFYRFADSVTANSEGMRQLLVQSYRIPESRALFMPNAYDFSSIRKMSQCPLSDPDLEQLIQGEEFILSVNRLDKQKLINSQLEVYAELRKNKPELKLLVVGDGPQKPDLLTLAHTFGLNTYSIGDSEVSLTNKFDVYFLGLINNPYRLYKLCKCLILTSEYESLPNVVIEALICDAIVVAADCRFGPREILSKESDYDVDFKDRYGQNEYGFLLPVPSEAAKTFSLWQKYLGDISNDKVDLRYKVNIPEKIDEYSKDNVLEKWETLIGN